MRTGIRFLLKNKVLRYPQFRNYLTLRLTVILALNMQMTIVSYLVYQLTKDPLSLGMIGLWEVIPAIGFSLISGAIVDPREKRTLMVKCLVGYLALAGLYFVFALPSFHAAAGTQATLWLIYAAVFIGGMLRAFLSPSNFALLGLLVPRELYANATTWSSTAWQLGDVVGPLLGGILIAIGGVETGMAFVFGILIFSFITILRIPKQAVIKKEKEPILKSLQEGLRFVFSTKIILVVLALDMFAVLFGGATALLPIYAEDILKTGAVGFGWLRAAPGIGAILTLVILSFMPLKYNAGKKMLLSVAGFGLTIIIFGVSDIFMVSFAMLLAGGMLDSVSVVIRGTILQLYTPDTMRGRVAAVNTMFISSSNELGALESGLTARWMGTVPAVVFGGCMTILTVAVTYWKVPLLRKIKLEVKD